MKDGQRGKRKKNEQRGKWKRPSCLSAVPASQLLPPLPVSATCAGAHLAAAGPVIPRPQQHTLLHCCHRQDSSAPSPWLYLGSMVLHQRLCRRCCCRPCLGLPRVSSQCVIRPPVSAVHGTSSLTDDVVAAVGFRSQVSEEKFTSLKSIKQSQVSVTV